jgi:hypothetical protein
MKAKSAEAKVVLPTPWRKYRRWDDVFFQDFGHGSIVFYPASNHWYLSAPRGLVAGAGTDDWGPWEYPLDREQEARAALAAWEKKLERIGWFKLPLFEAGSGHVAQLTPLIARLPRCKMIPSYFLGWLDEREAQAGRAVSQSGRILRIGAMDVHHHVSKAVDAGFYLETDVDLVITRPGDSPERNNRDAKRLHLSATELDAMIDFLMGLRSNLVDDETAQAANTRTFEWLPGDSGSGSPAGMQNRFRRIQQRAAEVNAVVKDLAGLEPDDFTAIQQLVSLLSQGISPTELRHMLALSSNASPHQTH